MLRFSWVFEGREPRVVRESGVSRRKGAKSIVVGRGAVTILVVFGGALA
jgi:hypothetical protein